MKNYFTYLIVLLVATTLFSSCEKKEVEKTDCFHIEATTRQIVNKQATIKLANNQFYIVENGAIDTKLIPCNLPQEFQINNLMVTISGDVKATLQNGGLCCSENFVISNTVK